MPYAVYADLSRRLTEQELSLIHIFSEAEQTKLESLRRDIQVGVDQLDRGEGSEMDWDAFFSDRHRAYAERHHVS